MSNTNKNTTCQTANSVAAVREPSEHYHVAASPRRLVARVASARRPGLVAPPASDCRREKEEH